MRIFAVQYDKETNQKQKHETKQQKQQ